jgi:coenzyme F420-reducing hydrogenase alpha subunit
MHKEKKSFNLTTLDLDIIFDNNTIHEAIIALQSKWQDLIKTYPQYDDYTFFTDYVDDGYSRGYKVMIQGTRLETDDEYKKRVEAERRMKEQQETKELNELARLKAKYEK